MRVEAKSIYIIHDHINDMNKINTTSNKVNLFEKKQEKL